MVFRCSKMKTLDSDVIMQNTSIQCVKLTTCLGVIIDNKLRWNNHIAYVKNKNSISLGILYKIRRYLDNATLTKVCIIFFCFSISYILC